MLYKTEEFAKQFLRDLLYISLDPNAYKRNMEQAIRSGNINPGFNNQALGSLKFVGSYSDKKWGSVITDIDLIQLTKYDQQLVEKIRRIFIALGTTPNCPFIFARLYCGDDVNVKPPFSIDENGSCNFSVEKMRNWYINLKGRIPEDVYENIGMFVNKDSLSLRDIVEITEIIRPYTSLMWKYDDVLNGYLIKDKKRYELLDVFNSYPRVVFKFLYIYIIPETGKKDYCFVDMSLHSFGKQYKKDEKEIRGYYLDDILSIFKSDKRRLDPKNTEIYKSYVEKYIRPYSGLSGRYELIGRLKKYRLISEDDIQQIERDTARYAEEKKITQRTEDELKKTIRDGLRTVMGDVKNLLTPENKELVSVFELRGKQAQIQIPITELIKREKMLECPFFLVNIQDVYRLARICRNIGLKLEKTYVCISKACKEYKKNVRDEIKMFLYGEKIRIAKKGDNYVLLHNDKKVAEGALKKLQALALCKNFS